MKTLGDIRTALGIHLRSTPAQKLTSYRDVYLLGTEKVRLRDEMGRLERQRGRVEKRLSEVRSKLEGLARAVQEDAQPQATPSGKPPAVDQSAPRPWKRMPLEY